MPYRHSSGLTYAPVGAVVFNAYWRERYTVLSYNENRSVTVRWHGKVDSLGLDRFPADRETTHFTPLDPRDVIESVPTGTPWPLTCTCGQRRRTADESPNSHGPECCTCPRGVRAHRRGCIASYLDENGKVRQH